MYILGRSEIGLYYILIRLSSNQCIDLLFLGILLNMKPYLLFFISAHLKNKMQILRMYCVDTGAIAVCGTKFKDYPYHCHGASKIVRYWP